MKMSLSHGLVLSLGLAALGCSSDSTPGPQGSSGSPSLAAGAGSRVTTPVAGGAGRSTGGAGSPAGGAGSPAGGAGSPAGGAGTGGPAGQGGVAGATLPAGAAGAGTGGAAAAGSGGSAGAAGSSAGGGNDLTGMLGALGPVQPVMNGWATTNGPETLIYLATAKLTCPDMMTMGVHWLSKLPAKSQVIEIVVPGAASAKMYTVGAPDRAEVNYAEGSKSSSTEVVGRAGSVTFTKVNAKMLYEGTIAVTSPFTASGTFHAEWCQGGAEY